jgi:hypothetical protein
MLAINLLQPSFFFQAWDQWTKYMTLNTNAIREYIEYS